MNTLEPLDVEFDEARLTTLTPSGQNTEVPARDAKATRQPEHSLRTGKGKRSGTHCSTVGRGEKSGPSGRRGSRL
jgi:hypothetical protein